MLLANVLWHLRRSKKGPSATKWETLRDFADVPNAPFSIHSIAHEASSAQHTPLTTWLGPNSVARALAYVFLSFSFSFSLSRSFFLFTHSLYFL
jgi:hypothetical protein